MNAVDVSSPILIHRAPHDTEHPYLKVSRAIIHDDRLSITARGLLVYLLAHKETWHIDPAYLAKQLQLNVATVRKLLHELSACGYVKQRERYYNAQGQIVWTDYQVYEAPRSTGLAGLPAPHHKEASLPQTTIHEKTMHGAATHGKPTPIIRIDSNKKEKESPAEKSALRASAALSPHGDSHAGFASRNEGKQLPPEPEEMISVKANDSSSARSLHDREKLLPVSMTRADLAPAPKAAPQATAHSHPFEPNAKPATPINAGPMQAVVVHAFKIGQGSYAGKIGQFLAAKLSPRRKDMWAQYQPDQPASPQEVMALLMWYRQHPAYASSCAERGGKLPSTPSILRDRLDEFRDSEGYAQALQAAQPLLDRLLRGESMVIPNSPAKPVIPQAMESVEAYKTYDPAKDPAYCRTVDPDALETLERLFGAV